MSGALGADDRVADARDGVSLACLEGMGPQIEPAGADVGEEPLQRRAAAGAAREAAILVEGGQSRPALVTLAGDVGEAGFALGAYVTLA